MKITKLVVTLLVLCLMLLSVASCNSTDQAKTDNDKKCDHEFKMGYCTLCNEMDPNCIKLTEDNYSDYLNVKYRIADVDGTTGGEYGFVAFPYIYLTATPVSNRVTFYDVSVEFQITVQQSIYDANTYEECTVNVLIPVSTLGNGSVEKRLDRETYEPVLLKKTYVESVEVVSVKGCVSIGN